MLSLTHTHSSSGWRGGTWIKEVNHLNPPKCVKSQKKGWSRSGGVKFLRKMQKNGEGGGWKEHRHFCMILRNAAAFSASKDKECASLLLQHSHPSLNHTIWFTTNSTDGLLFYYFISQGITQYYTLKPSADKVKTQDAVSKDKSCICWCWSVDKNLRQHLSKGLWEWRLWAQRICILTCVRVCVCVADWLTEQAHWVAFVFYFSSKDICSKLFFWVMKELANTKLWHPIHRCSSGWFHNEQMEN